jgi:predicted ATP-dependent endonuclease of OLD family
MRIKKVKIKNFRGFKNEVDISFDAKWTSLVGKNGTGKTSVLEALRLASSISWGRVKADDFYDDSQPIEICVEFDGYFLYKINDFQKIPSKEIKFEAKHRDRAAPRQAFSQLFVSKHTIIPACYGSYSELNPSLTETSYVVKQIRKKSDSDTYEYWVEKNNGFKELATRLLDVYSEDDIEGLPRVFYFDKSRDKGLKGGQGTLFKKIVDELNWRFFKEYKSKPDVTEAYISQWEDFYNFVISKVDDPKQSKIIQPLKAEIVRLLGNKLEHFEISLLDPANPFSNAFFSLREKDKVVSLGNLGSGEVMIITYFLLRLTSELSKEEIIFLIDEPELHLHPQLQSQLFSEIESSEYQHIFSTHSDIFVDVSEWKSIKRLTDQKIFPNKEVLENKLSSNATGLTKKSLAEHLEDIRAFCHDKTIFFRENNEILFADKCLLVEGANDKYGLSAAAIKFERDFSSITIINCVGKTKIPYYAIFCLAFGVDFFCVYDFDQGTSEEGKDDLIKEYAGDGKYFSFNSSFEQIIGKEKLNQILDVVKGWGTSPKEIKDCLDSVSAWVKK